MHQMGGGVLQSSAAAVVGGEADEFLPIWGIWRRDFDWAMEISNAMSRRNLRISAAANTNEFSSIFSDGGCKVLNSDSKDVNPAEEFSVRPCEGVGTQGKHSTPLAKHPS